MGTVMATSPETTGVATDTAEEGADTTAEEGGGSTDILSGAGVPGATSDPGPDWGAATLASHPEEGAPGARHAAEAAGVELEWAASSTEAPTTTDAVDD